MIQVDDAGSGSLIGGTTIGILRIESNEYYCDNIPIKLYDKNNFKKKLYLNYATEIIKKAFESLRVDKNEPILVCQGYMFDHARRYLKDNNFKFINVRIKEPLQSIVEQSFEDHVVSLGLPRDFLKFTKYPFHFHRLLRWVYADYPNRIKLCKTGWKSWEKFGHLKVSIDTDYIYSGNYYCLKCGKKILMPGEVKVIKYTSNMPNTIYLHKHC